jgi:hypothetical protein
MSRRIYKVTTLEQDTTTEPVIIDDDVVDDFHLLNIVVNNCCYSFFCLSVLTLFFILVLYLAVLSAYVEQIGDPTAAIINAVLQVQANNQKLSLAAVNVACYTGSIGSCENLASSDAQLERIRPVVN